MKVYIIFDKKGNVWDIVENKEEAIKTSLKIKGRWKEYNAKLKGELLCVKR